MMCKHKLIHDQSFAEQNSGYQYVVLKVLDEGNDEVGQIKLEFTKTSIDENPKVRISTHGEVGVDCFTA